MNYSTFSCFEDNISTLTKQEIENPFLVLDALYTKQNPKNLREDLWNFFWIIFKEDEWLQHGASYYYRIYKDLIKLIDALWLINKYCPELSTIKTIKGPASQTNAKSTDQAHNFNLAFNRMLRTKADTDPEELESIQTNVLSSIYKQFHMGFTKSDVYNYLQIGLDASYMKADKYGYFVLQEYDVISDFLNFDELIQEGYVIYQKETFPPQRNKSDEYIKLSSDADHPTELYKESIIDPSNAIDSFYRYYFDINCINEGLMAWQNLLYEKNFWKKNGNPGNVLYLRQCLEKLLDGAWLYFQIDGTNAESKEYKVKRSEIIKDPVLSEEEHKNPLPVILSFFEFKKLHEWKKQLEEWVDISLSDTETIKPEDKARTAEDFSHLLRFIKATYLMV